MSNDKPKLIWVIKNFGWDDIPKIEKYLVVKETEKSYIIKCRQGTQTFPKNKRSNAYGASRSFYESEEEALKSYKARLAKMKSIAESIIHNANEALANVKSADYTDDTPKYSESWRADYT